MTPGNYALAIIIRFDLRSVKQHVASLDPRGMLCQGEVQVCLGDGQRGLVCWIALFWRMEDAST